MFCGRLTIIVIKSLFFFYNVVFALVGIGLITVGSKILVQIGDVDDLIPVNLNEILTGLIVVGCVLLLNSICGFCATFRKSIWLIFTYSIIITGLAGVKIWLLILIFQNMKNLRERVEFWVSNLFTFNETLHRLETAFQCCGTTGPDSYVSQGIAIPSSCCSNYTDNTCLGEDAYEGCTERFWNYFSTYGNIVGFSLIIVIIIQLNAALFALFLNYYRKQKKLDDERFMQRLAAPTPVAPTPAASTSVATTHVAPSNVATSPPHPVKTTTITTTITG